MKLFVALLAVLMATTVFGVPDTWPKFNQCSEAWGNATLASDPTTTLCTNGSLITALSMVLKDWGVTAQGGPANMTPGELNTFVKTLTIPKGDEELVKAIAEKFKIPTVRCTKEVPFYTRVYAYRVALIVQKEDGVWGAVEAVMGEAIKTAATGKWRFDMLWKKQVKLACVLERR